MKIEARDVDFTYEYGNGPVLSGINLYFDSDEKVALLGANGCGKTTLLKIFCGLLAPTRGTILIDDKEVKRKPSYNFRVGFVPENPDEMFFESTVEREISFILKRKGENGIEEKVSNIMQRFDLYKLRNKSPFEISSGEKRKLAIASIAVAQQPLILLDEPISGLDLSGIIAVENWISCTTGIVATTHRTDFARNFDKIVLMNDGCILEENIELNLDTYSRELLERANVMLLCRE